jgi:hypothetical protein
MTESHCEIALDELSQIQQLGSPRFFSVSIVSNLSYSIQNIRNDPPKPKKDHFFINIHKLDKSKHLKQDQTTTSDHENLEHTPLIVFAEKKSPPRDGKNKLWMSEFP